MSDTAGPNVAPLIENLASIGERYDVLFCDVWGVLHNGVRENAPAGAALEQFRATGGSVVLVTNAPVPREQVAHILDARQVRRSAWDAIVTSGDVTRALMLQHGARGVFHIGPDRDLSLFRDQPVARVALEAASVGVVTGLLHEERETAGDYRATLERLKARGLRLICANPDRVVHVGDRLLPCAGAIADLYEEMGGETIWAGKPYAPIYAEAFTQAAALRGPAPAKARILMIGDSAKTDLIGANRFGIDALFIAHGVHRGEFDGPGDAAKAATSLLRSSGAQAIGFMPVLR